MADGSKQMCEKINCIFINLRIALFAVSNKKPVMQKKLLILTLSFFTCLLVDAQIKKDNWLLGGQVSFGSNNTTSGNSEQKNNGTFIQLSAGKAFRDNHVFSGQASAGFSEVNFFNGVETGLQKNQDFSAGVFYRLYKNLGKDFFFFGQANADFRWGNGETTFPSNVNNREFSSFGGSVSVTPGLAYAVFPKFHIELTLPGLFGIGYSRGKTTFPNASSPEEVTTNFNAFTSIGPGSQAGILGVGFRLVL
jgi:hypothetical protein